MKTIKTLAVSLCTAVLFISCNNSVKVPDLENFTYNSEEFQRQYVANKAEWDAAFAFLARTDLDTLTAGPWHQLTPETRARVQKTFTKEVGKWEIHRKVVDLFYVLEGVDKVGISKLENLEEVKREYSEEKDSGIYVRSNDPSYVVLEKGKGVLLFPCDGHSPNLCTDAPDSLKIIVIKVPYVNETR